MSIFKGAGVAIVTPFTESNKVDYNMLEELIDFQIDNGTDSIIICGTTGEASTLSHEEHLECIKVAVDRANKRVPVIAGTGSNCTDTAVYLSGEAKKRGADGLLLVTPYYNKATQRGLTEHFTEIAKAVDLPIVMYNVPGRTGCNLSPKTTADLAKNIDNIVAVKEASGNIAQIAQIMHLAEGNIDLYAGNDDYIVPVMSLGGIGVISVLSNILPKETHDIVELYLAGETKKSLEIQLKYMTLIDLLFCEVNPIPVKKALELMGKKVGKLRKPLTEMEDVNVQKLSACMKSLNII